MGEAVVVSEVADYVCGSSGNDGCANMGINSIVPAVRDYRGSGSYSGRGVMFVVLAGIMAEAIRVSLIMYGQ